MTSRAPVKQSDISRVVRGALKGGLPVGSFMVEVVGNKVRLLPVAANESQDEAADAERRMREAFGEE